MIRYLSYFLLVFVDLCICVFDSAKIMAKRPVVLYCEKHKSNSGEALNGAIFARNRCVTLD